MTDIITQPTPRELYSRQFDKDSVLWAQWKNAFESVFEDSLEIDLPYTEQGRYFLRNTVAYGYNLNLFKGEVLHVEVRTDSLFPTVFLDLYRKTSDSLNSYDFMARSEYQQKTLKKPIERSGMYKLVVQPGFDVETPFQIKIYTRPLYAFPVAGKDHEAIQSFWGDPRDGGRRTHQGVDIFADRGTPALAVTEGRISYTGERGLGGKQVRLRAGLFGNSLYYAHLDSILVNLGKRVKVGDTLGLVGNTGNARTTKPHLHFGIYVGYRGAIDPLPFIRLNEMPQIKDETSKIDAALGLVSATRANLRNSPSVQGQKIGEARQSDTLSILGITGKWIHITTKIGQKAYVHGSLLDFVSETATTGS